MSSEGKMERHQEKKKFSTQETDSHVKTLKGSNTHQLLQAGNSAKKNRQTRYRAPVKEKKLFYLTQSLQKGRVL